MRLRSCGVVVLGFSTLAGACASTGPSRPMPFPSPAGSHPAEVRGTVLPASGPSSSVPALAGAIIASALSLRGTPYRFGGATPADGFDCSGLVSFVAHSNGVGVPRTVLEQFGAGVAIERSDLAPGDLVFYSTTGPGPTHVGIVVSAGQNPQFVHAPADGSTVRTERLDTPYWEHRWVGARRVF
jgi:cell wall-associated NlpC family hydrolase